MKAVTALPEEYREILSIDLQKNRKLSFAVNGLAILIGVILFFIGNSIVPITCLFNMDQGILNYTLRFAILIGSMAVYIVLHELIHGITMKLLGTKKVKFGFTGLYAFAGSDDYYNKSSYITIALAPVVLWGIVIAVINCFVTDTWFWVVYLIQITNLSGAAGDFLVSIWFSRLPKDILVKDSGIAMTVYSKK